MYKYTAKLSIQYPSLQNLFILKPKNCDLNNEMSVENNLLGNTSKISLIFEDSTEQPDILLIKELRLESEFTDLQTLTDFQKNAKAILNKSLYRICFFSNADIDPSEIETYFSIVNYPDIQKNNDNPCRISPAILSLRTGSIETSIIPKFSIEEYKILLQKKHDITDQYIREYLDIKKIKNPETRLFALARLRDLIDLKNPNKKTIDVDKLNQAARHLVTHGHLISSSKSKNNKECFEAVKQYFLCSCQVDIKPQIEEKYKDKIIFDRNDPQHIKLVKSAVHEFDRKIEEYLRKVAILN